MDQDNSGLGVIKMEKRTKASIQSFWYELFHILHIKRFIVWSRELFSSRTEAANTKGARRKAHLVHLVS